MDRRGRGRSVTQVMVPPLDRRGIPIADEIELERAALDPPHDRDKTGRCRAVASVHQQALYGQRAHFASKAAPFAS